MSDIVDENFTELIASKAGQLGPDDRPREELQYYLQVAGMCWCTTWTSHTEMDTQLAEAFARVLRLCIEEVERGEARENGKLRARVDALTRSHHHTGGGECECVPDIRGYPPILRWSRP